MPHNLLFDFGNFDIKWTLDSNAPQRIRSQRFQLPFGCNALKADARNPIVEYQGIRYHYGAKANEYRSQDPTVLGEKEDLILPALFTALPPLSGQLDYQVSLKLFHPSPEYVEDQLKDKVLGVHSYKYNGELLRVNVADCEVLPEGLGSYLYAKARNLVPKKGYTVIIDIGGGTWISRLFNADGEIIDSTVSDVGGAIALAQSIATDRRLEADLRPYRMKPNASLIMDGLAANNTYGSLAVTWKPYLNEYLHPWFAGIVQEVKTKYNPYGAFISKFILTGGSSQLVSSLVSGIPMFSLLDDPQFANIIGVRETILEDELSNVRA